MSIWMQKLIEKHNKESGWYVVGGEFSNTEFNKLIDGSEPYIEGPFKKYDLAYDHWKAKAWETVDNCCERYSIIEKNVHLVK